MYGKPELTLNVGSGFCKGVGKNSSKIGDFAASPYREALERTP